MRRLPQLDPEVVTIVPVHCFGCGRQIGVAQEIKMVSYCEEQCWHKPQLIGIENAARDRFLHALSDRGLLQADLADAYGLTRTRVGQILAASNGEDYLAAGRREPDSAEFVARRVRAGKIGGANRWNKSRE